ERMVGEKLVDFPFINIKIDADYAQSLIGKSLVHALQLVVVPLKLRRSSRPEDDQHGLPSVVFNRNISTFDCRSGHFERSANKRHPPHEAGDLFRKDRIREL